MVSSPTGRGPVFPIRFFYHSADVMLFRLRTSLLHKTVTVSRPSSLIFNQIDKRFYSDTTGQYIPSAHSYNGTLYTSLPGYPTGIDDLVIQAANQLPEFPYTEDMNQGSEIGLGTSQLLLNPVSVCTHLHFRRRLGLRIGWLRLA